MVNMTNVIKNTISISLFNRGLAGKIFEEVKATGAKVVMKNNTAECVLLSPKEYVQLMDELNDARLLALANQRMQRYSSEAILSEDEVFYNLGIKESDLEGYNEVEFERSIKHDL